MGATCLARGARRISAESRCCPRALKIPAQFLRSLDCFVYRTSSRWFEAYGRVVMEAMATGLPVVVGARGGYVEQLRDGVSGIVVSSTDEAIARVLVLASDRDRAAAIGAAACRCAFTFNAEDLPRRTVALLTGRKDVDRLELRPHGVATATG